MATLSQYIADTQRLLKDTSYQTLSQTDLVSCINKARTRTAQDTKCCRLLLSGQAPISSVNMVSNGSGYTNPVVTIAGGMGTGAVLTPTVVGGQITAITVTNGGANYSPPLAITITDPTGTGASATATQINLLQANTGQEVYRYSDQNALVQQSPGYKSVLDVMSVAVLWSGMKPVLGERTFDQIQAYARAYAVPVLGQPYIFAKYGRGAAGSLYLWQIPSQACAMDWDCACFPIDLVDDTTVDVIPDPFTEAVPYYAARLAYLNAQRYEDSNYMKAEYQNRTADSIANTSATLVPSMYDESW